MTDSVSINRRRRFIKLAVAGLAGAPLAGVIVSGAAHAQALVSETDPQAVGLGYKADAAKATARKDPQAHCGNCNLYTGKAGAAEGPCAIFPGKLVSAKGFCNAWVKKV
jgi:uncharacterized low-complexity protein